MNTTSYKGINYAGHSGVNQDKASGIRYGVIPQNEVVQAWTDSSEADYGKPSEPCECPACGRMAAAPENWGDYFECADEECGHKWEAEFPDCAEPLGFTYKSDGYAAQCGEDGDIFIVKSPFFTYAQFCSPCAPGACYLLNPLDEPDDNNRAFCFGHDWFEGGVAPYPIYSIETGELVNPEI